MKRISGWGGSLTGRGGPVLGKTLYIYVPMCPMRKNNSSTSSSGTSLA